MSVKLEKVENGKAIFELEIDAAAFEEAVEKTYKKNVSKMNIPGFRRGKAPRKMIEKQYGEGVFYDDTINNILPDAYDKAIDELELEPIDRPNVEVLKAGGNENLVVKITVDVKPDVKLGEYKGIEVKKIEYNVTDQDVEKDLSALAERNSRLITVEGRAVADGDTVTLDAKGFRDGVAFEGGTVENHDLVIGSGQFIPGFEPQLIGKNVGDEFTINVTFPADYQMEELAGKDAEFEIKIHAIKVKELPAMDDEFAKDVSEFDTLDELKESIKERLETNSKARQKAETENAVIEKVVENIEVELPEIMIEEQIKQIAMDMDRSLQAQGLNLQKYFELTNMTIDTFKEQSRSQATMQVKSNLAIAAISKEEGISVSDEDIEAEYIKMAEKYSTPLEQVKQYINPKMVKKDLVMMKTIDMLVENAKFI